jgi:AraC-like DNA-binding protein
VIHRQIKSDLLRVREELTIHHASVRTLGEAASLAYLSPFHFQRTFREMFHESPHEFVTRLRMEEARRLLVDSDQTISEICLTVGYVSLASFSTKFRAQAGRSPKEYREEARRLFAIGRVWSPKRIPCCFIPRHLRP